ncbi:MAG: hypothetical protein Q4G03_05410 [Planctomycetia bacterium]|nr:hypothetical protein [Planctomycetia bacterium]
MDRRISSMTIVAAGALTLLSASAMLFNAQGSSAQTPTNDSVTPQVVSSTPDSSSQAPTMFVLTRLGEIIEGRPIDRGQSFMIELPGGGAVTASKLDVLFIGDTRESVYRFKASQTHLEDANETLKLVDWASRRRLGAEAIKTLEVQLGASTDPAARSLYEKRLKELRRSEELRINAERALAQRRNSPELVQNNVATDDTQRQELQELEDWIKGVPSATVERFMRRAQPILQRRCGKSGCHDEQTPGAKFRVKAKGLGAAQRLATLYNLRDATVFVDFDSPAASVLINHPSLVDARGVPLRPFGADRTSDKDAQILMSWIESLEKESKLAERALAYRCVRSDAPQLRPNAASRYDRVSRDDVDPDADLNLTPSGETNSLAEASPNFTEAYARAPDQPGQAGATPENGASPFRQGVSQEALRLMQGYDADDPNDPNSQTAALQRVGMTPKKEYRDEYDPMIFNDRYFPNQKN